MREGKVGAMGRMMLFAVFAVCLPAAVTTATAASFVSPPSRASVWRGIARCVTGHNVRTELRLTEWCQKRRSQCTISHCVSHTGWTAKQTPHGDQVSRRRLAIGSSLSISAFLCGVVPDAARAATSMRSLKRALVNIIRVREGSALLHRRLEDNLLGGFQDGVKLLAADTEIFKNVKIACQGLVELQLQSSVANAELKADRIVTFLSQIVEYDGWDKMNRMDIRERFQEMTPEKIVFAKRGLGEVQKEAQALIALFPQQLVAEAEELYKGMYAVN